LRFRARCLWCRINRFAAKISKNFGSIEKLPKVSKVSKVLLWVFTFVADVYRDVDIANEYADDVRVATLSSLFRGLRFKV